MPLRHFVSAINGWSWRWTSSSVQGVCGGLLDLCVRCYIPYGSVGTYLYLIVVKVVWLQTVFAGHSCPGVEGTKMEALDLGESTRGPMEEKPAL